MACLRLFSIVLLFLLAACVPANPATPGQEPTSLLKPTQTTIQDTPTPDPASLPRETEPATFGAGLQSIAGVVLSGGDQTPKGLLDAPRPFVYQVQLDSSATIDVKFFSYPPSPAGDLKKFVLEFHAGSVQVGDYLEARGTFDPASNTLLVDAEGDYIRTFASKP